MQASLLYYHHAGIAHSMAYDHGEAGVNWIYRDVLTFGLSAVRIIGARDQQPRPAADIDFHWPLVEHVSFSAGAGIAHSPPFRYEYNGHYHYDQGTLYHYGHAGLLWSKGPWRVELDRVLTDLESRHSRGDMAAAPWLATISLSF